MRECFNQASFAYESSDKASAPYYSQLSHSYRDRRNELNAKLVGANKVKEARQKCRLFRAKD